MPATLQDLLQECTEDQELHISESISHLEQKYF